MEEKPQFLVFLFLNDNHLSNVKTLHSVYEQNYPNIFLIACNDCTDEFQCERFLYNLEEKRRENIKGIYLYESPYPLGECRIQKELWKITDAEYIITLHSGEYFANKNVLRRCAEIMKRNVSAEAVTMNAELWSDDMESCLLEYSAFSKADATISAADKEKMLYRDFMFAYRKKTIEKIIFSQGNELVNQKWWLELLGGQYNVSKQRFTCCKYSAASIKNTESLIPKIFGNERIQNIQRKLREMQQSKK